MALRVALLPDSDCGDPDTRKVSGNSPLFSQSQQIKSTSNKATTMLSIFELFAIIEADDLDGSSIINDSKTDDSRLSWVLSNPSNGLIRFLGFLWLGH